MNIREKALKLHKESKGKIEVTSKISINSLGDLNLVYTPGVAEPCKEIKSNPKLAYDYTSKGNMVAIITDGSAVLGLGNIGGLAGMPVMEGKAVLFKVLAGVDAFPICLETQDEDEIVDTIKNISPSFGGINLEDISSPRCFEIENRLKQELNIPVFHDDQHGTAVVVLAGIINGLKVVNKCISDIKIVINGAGAAGIAVTKLLLRAGANNILVCDSKGILNRNRDENNWSKSDIANITNEGNFQGTLEDALVGADVFIGLSGPQILSKEMVSRMNEDSIVFALANPVPEIWPKDAKKGGARIVGTGRSDFPNQINNILAFPGIFKGALKVRAREINEDMKLAAAYAIANIVTDSQLNEENILPTAFEGEVGKKVGDSVAKAAIESKVARVNVDL